MQWNSQLQSLSCIKSNLKINLFNFRIFCCCFYTYIDAKWSCRHFVTFWKEKSKFHILDVSSRYNFFTCFFFLMSNGVKLFIFTAFEIRARVDILKCVRISLCTHLLITQAHSLEDAKKKKKTTKRRKIVKNVPTKTEKKIRKKKKRR